MNKTGAVRCENCRIPQRIAGEVVSMNLMLGSITNEGILYAKLYKGGVAKFTDGTIALQCTCGYTVQVNLTSQIAQASDHFYDQN